jgi:hypothetical protein
MTDNSMFVPNHQAVTSDSLFALKPSAVRSRSYRASIAPTNKSTFAANDMAIFYVPAGRRGTFLDTAQSYVRMTVKNGDGTNQIIMDCNASCFINRLDVFHGSNMLETIQAYNVLYQYLLDFQLNASQKTGLSSMYGLGQLATSRAGGIIGPNAQFTAAMPLLSATVGLGSDKFLPIGQLSDDIRLEFSFEANNTAVSYQTTGGSAAAAGGNWSIVNMELDLCIVELSDEGMSMVNSVTPFNEPVYLHGNSWRHYTSSLPASSTGTYSTLVPARFASLKTLLCLPRRGTEISNVSGFSLSSRVNPNIAQYWWRIGAYIIPQKSVNLINSATTGGYGEGFAEIQKSFHSLNNADSASSLTFALYNTADAADATVGLGGVTAVAAGVNSFGNAFAISQELESFANRSDVIISGINTLQSQVFFEANIGTTAPTSAYTLDFYANYDNILVLDQTGILSARF